MNGGRGFFSLAIVLFGLLSMPSFAQQESDPDTVPGWPVAVVDKKFNPDLDLSIDSASDDFRVGEKVAFELVVTNKSNFPVKALPIDDKTTFCSFNEQHWGTKAPSGSPAVVLMPGESLRKKFKLSGLAVPKELKISCSYGMGVNGVRPVAYKALNIVR